LQFKKRRERETPLFVYKKWGQSKQKSNGRGRQAGSLFRSPTPALLRVGAAQNGVRRIGQHGGTRRQGLKSKRVSFVRCAWLLGDKLSPTTERQHSNEPWCSWIRFVPFQLIICLRTMAVAMPNGVVKTVRLTRKLIHTGVRDRLSWKQNVVIK
jgi:hypothetical protein